jgi:hypothetical protein
VGRSEWVVPDETGWRVGGCPAWLHALVGPEATAYVCLMRGTMSITSWTADGFSWPRCLPREGKSYPSLLADDELARAVRSEAAADHPGCDTGLQRA